MQIAYIIFNSVLIGVVLAMVLHGAWRDSRHGEGSDVADEKHA